MKKVILILMWGLLTGCAHRGVTTENSVSTTMDDSTLVHKFEVKDSRGVPVEGALVKPTTVVATTIDNDKELYPSCTTDVNGMCEFSLTSQFNGKYVKPYTVVFGEVSKAGYLTVPAFNDQRNADKPRGSRNITLDPIQQTFMVRFSAKDINNNPLPGVKAKANLIKYAGEVECTTDSTGMCEKKLEVTVSQAGSSILTAYAYLSGMYNQSLRKENITFAQSIIDLNFVLDRPSDYVCDEVKKLASHSLADQMTTWVDSLRTKALIQDTVVSHGNFCTSVFKNKKFASVKLSSTLVYNSLKLSPYQIGTRVFDDVVRKMLDIVAPAVATFPLEGYEIAVKTATGDATEKYIDKRLLNYQFYLPKKSVTSYKNKDITGQQLIDSSIVLLNDERIDLKLQ
jgi:hypothetical protein